VDGLWTAAEIGRRASFPQSVRSAIDRFFRTRCTGRRAPLAAL